MESAIAIGISIGALVVSMISPLFEYCWNKRLNKKNIESECFKEIFGDIIFQELPRAREYIHFDDKTVTGTEPLEDVLRMLRRRAVFYKNRDHSFYENFIKAVQTLEDYIVVPGDLSAEKFAEYYNRVDQLIEGIFNSVQKYL